eukprot:6205176-Pleurochrysis_carterae.AAC.3
MRLPLPNTHAYYRLAKYFTRFGKLRAPVTALGGTFLCKAAQRLGPNADIALSGFNKRVGQSTSPSTPAVLTPAHVAVSSCCCAAQASWATRPTAASAAATRSRWWRCTCYAISSSTSRFRTMFSTGTAAGSFQAGSHKVWRGTAEARGAAGKRLYRCTEHGARGPGSHAE